LGKNLRYVSSNSEDFVYLQDEVNFIREYLRIQKFRYENRLSYEIDIDAKALRCIVPKMILQPFVENSIEHGIGDGALKINVYSKRENNKLLLFVEDDGKGIDNQKAEQILKRLYEDSSDNYKPEDIKYLGKGYARNNINRRLKLYYGEDCGIYIDMQYTEGARFFLKMPYNSEEV